MASGVGRNRSQRSLGIWVGLLGLVLAAGSCSRHPAETVAEAESAPTKKAKEDFDPSLTFNNVTLEQMDSDGQKRWSLLAQRVTYSRDRKLATASDLVGKLYSDGEYAYDAKAAKAILSQNGERIILKGEIEVVDRQDGTVFSANEVEWIPDDDRMLFKGDVQAVHEEGKLSAQAGELLEADRILKLNKEVTIEATEAQLLLSAEQGTWQIDEEMILAEGALIVERYEGEGEEAKVVDRASSEKGSLDLAVQLVTLEGTAQLIFGEPSVAMSSDRLLWDIPGNLLSSDVPLTIINEENQVALAGQRGKFNVQDEILELTGGIEALADGDQARMTADNLTWSVATQTFNAVGNVRYSQTEPRFNLRGPQAEGKLEEETFVVTGGDVVTEIIPDGELKF